MGNRIVFVLETKEASKKAPPGENTGLYILHSRTGNKIPGIVARHRFGLCACFVRLFLTVAGNQPMKILINSGLPFALAHGGAQIQIEQTLAALKSIGLEAEPLRWWDDQQRGDVIHYFGRMPAEHIKFTQQKGIKVVIAELLTAQGSRSQPQLRLQKFISKTVTYIAPQNFTAAFNWDSYQLADACVALTPWEASLMHQLFDAPKERVHVVPNGIEEVFLNSLVTPRNQWLVCTATITERKRVLELAKAAVKAQIPVWIIGQAYNEMDPYAQEFYTLAHQHRKIIRYEGAIPNRARLAQIYREARGFVLLSAMESLSLSALEATACECPLLLSDLPWARATFGADATYCPITSPERTAGYLKQFHHQAPSLKPPSKPLTWREVACQLKSIYESVLTGRPTSK